MFAQQRLGIRYAVFNQGGGGRQQARIARRAAYVLGVSRIGLRVLASGHQDIAQRTPRLRQLGLQHRRQAQRRHGLLSLPATAQGNAQVELRVRPVGLRAHQLLKHVDGALHVALRRARPCEQAHGHRLVLDDFEDFGRLLGGHRRVALQQARSVRQRLLQGAAGVARRHRARVQGSMDRVMAVGIRRQTLLIGP